MVALPREVGAVFARQDGLATTQQLEAAGVTRAMVRSRLGSEEWQRVTRTVIAAASTPWTWLRSVRAAVLDVGELCAVADVTAGRLQRFDGLGRETATHLVTAGSGHRTTLPGVTIHRSQLFDPNACDCVEGIRVVTRPLALVQIATTQTVDVVAKALDGMLRNGDSPNWIAHVARDSDTRGGRGARLVLQLLDQRTGRRLPRSWFQRVASRLLASHGVRLVDEHPVNDPQTRRRLADLDLALPELLIGVECQSWEWHGSPSDQARDARRRRRLRLLGWEIVDVWWTDLDRLEEIVAELQYLIDRRRSVRPLGAGGRPATTPAH